MVARVVDLLAHVGADVRGALDDDLEPHAHGGDQGATVAAILGGLALGSTLLAWLLRELLSSAVGGALFLFVAPIVGLYAVLFALGALANHTPEPLRAWSGAIAGALPPVLVV